ncbi:MAG TPA: Mur ligase family protein, partial [Pyrinomonadaceae bacterium]|nr:Mur ligase family protein [Pyrinomonadaceae bacterium]
MSFDEAVTYLLSLGHETLAMKLGLRSVARLLARTGDPHRSFDAVQIAGTNGKGSTAAMLDAVCCAARIRTGLYTSPHLVSITERIKIDGREVSRDEFALAARVVRDASEELARESGARPTFFEQVTAIALLIFRDAGVSLAVLETGLGGRLDATTAACARVLGITSIALDHQEHLGPTLAHIAAEKAGAIRAGVTESVVVARQTAEAEEVVRARAAECGVEPRFATRDISFDGACGAGRVRATFRTERDVYEGVCLSLRGRHQAENAAVAIALAEVLRERGYHISREHIVGGLEHAEHAGRLELIEGEPAVLLDGAHNVEGARALREYLAELGRAPVTLVFGAMRD